MWRRGGARAGYALPPAWWSQAMHMHTTHASIRALLSPPSSWISEISAKKIMQSSLSIQKMKMQPGRSTQGSRLLRPLLRVHHTSIFPSYTPSFSISFMNLIISHPATRVGNQLFQPQRL